MLPEQLLFYMGIATASSALAGMAASRIRNGDKTATTLAWYGLYSGMSGASLFCVLHHYLGKDSLLLILGLCMISALTGHKLVAAVNEVAMKIARKFSDES